MSKYKCFLTHFLTCCYCICLTAPSYFFDDTRPVIKANCKKCLIYMQFVRILEFNDQITYTIAVLTVNCGRMKRSRLRHPISSQLTRQSISIPWILSERSCCCWSKEFRSWALKTNKKQKVLTNVIHIAHLFQKKYS